MPLHLPRFPAPLQVLSSETHGQQLSYRLDLYNLSLFTIYSLVIPLPTIPPPSVHPNLHLRSTELPDELPAHAARTRWWVHIGAYC